jgi:sugar lactone lactonase YvrE
MLLPWLLARSANCKGGLSTMRLLPIVLLTLVMSGWAFGQTFTISTFAGNGTAGYSGDNGPATSATLSPGGIAVDSAGNLYVADSNRIRKVSKGVITTVAGNGTYGYSGDNGAATSAQLFNPQGVAVDAAGNLYIADTYNNRIRKVSGGVITTVAGNGTSGSLGENIPATTAQLNWPYGVAVDAAGNLYIANTYNNRICKVSNGMITTVAGNGIHGYSGDNGPATSAQLSWPDGVAVDAAGNLYIADTDNNRIRKVSGGVITTVAGNGTEGFSGDNGPATAAQLGWPYSVAVDAAGNFYIADTYNNHVRKVSNGAITTVGGNGTFGFGGDNGPATSAAVSPAGVAVDSAGRLYIAENVNNRIRVLTPAGSR